jgi:hypothetical protein
MKSINCAPTGGQDNYTLMNYLKRIFQAPRCYQSLHNDVVFWYINYRRKQIELLVDSETGRKRIEPIPWSLEEVDRIQRQSKEISYEKYLNVRLYIIMVEGDTYDIKPSR